MDRSLLEKIAADIEMMDQDEGNVYSYIIAPMHSFIFNTTVTDTPTFN